MKMNKLPQIITSLLFSIIVLHHPSNAANIRTQYNINNNDQHQQTAAAPLSPTQRKLQSLNFGSIECANCPENDFQRCLGTTIADPLLCLPCGSGQQWWPCNVVNECYCRKFTDAPTVTPTSSPIHETPSPSTSYKPTSGAAYPSSYLFGSSSGSNNYGDSGGLAEWAIFLITIFMLIIVCCGGYWIAVIYCGLTNCFKFDGDEQPTKGLDKNIHRYLNEHNSQYTGTQQSRVLALPSRADDDRTQDSRTRRDPTMYISSQDELPDPDASSTRRYYEDPPLKPKRDPTMYMDGLPEQYSVASSYKSQRDPTMYMDGLPEQYSVASSYKSQRDSTMYVDEKESKIEEVYTEDRGGIASTDDHQESYDQFGFKKSYMPDYVDASSRGDASFMTEEHIAGLGSRDAPSSRQSMPGIGNEDVASQEERQAKSFYR